MAARKFVVYSCANCDNFCFLLVKMPWEDDALNEGLVTHAPFCETAPGGWVEEYKICSL
jgi:hypothetical protein